VKVILKIVGINLLVFGFLAFLGNFLSIAAIWTFNRSKPKTYEAAHLLPNYQGAAWAKVHFDEYSRLASQYEAFLGWRRLPFQGATINLDEEGLRRTWRRDGASPAATVAFFGGSTTWGTGAVDADTIPSLFAKLNPGYLAHNFGETGYMAHQSLNLLMKRYVEGFRPDLVVFYDGVNDTGKCRRELDTFSHSREAELRAIIHEGSSRNPESFGFLFLPMRNFVEKVARVLDIRSRSELSFYNCHEQPEKAELIARSLLQDWLFAKQLIEGYGGRFVAVLQPVAYLSRTRLDHLELAQGFGRQYEVVYPVILKLLREEPGFAPLWANFLDLRDALDRDEYVYIDWCHLSPNGNEIVAARISEAVAQRNGPRISVSRRPDAVLPLAPRELAPVQPAGAGRVDHAG
jgi:hypothetical protein